MLRGKKVALMHCKLFIIEWLRYCEDMKKSSLITLRDVMQKHKVMIA